MGRAWLLSAVMHGALAVALYVGLPALSRPPVAIERPITVELVTELETDPEPPAPAPVATAPEPERSAASPEPAPAEPEPEVAKPAPAPEPSPEIAQPEPVPEPEPEVVKAPEPAPAPQEVARLEPEPAPQPAPLPTEPTPKPQAIPSPQPRLKPKPPKTPPPEPEPQAREKPPEPPKKAPAKEPEKAPEPPKEDSFAALLKSVEQLDRRDQGETEQKGIGQQRPSDQGEARNSLGDGRLTFSEVDALRRQIGRCWTLPVGADRIAGMVVKLRIQVRPDRTVQQVSIQDGDRMAADPTFRAVAESARRAVDRCSPLQLPPGKYTIWRDIVMSFYPEDAISG
jgi:hypothetical protein